MPPATKVSKAALTWGAGIDPELKPLADELVDVARSAAEKAIAADAGQAVLSNDAGSLEQAFAETLRAAPEAQRLAARQVVLPELLRKRLVRVDLRSATPVEQQAAPVLSETVLKAIRVSEDFRIPSKGKVDIDAKAKEHASWLGAPQGPITACPDGHGKFRHFAHGSVYWTPETGAHEVHGAIRDAWASMGWERSYLGYPVSDELTVPDTIGRISHFQGGTVYWRPERGAFAVHADVMEVYGQHRWEQGVLGYPIEPTQMGSPKTQRFEGGIVRGGAAQFPKTKLVTRLHEIKLIDETDAPWPVGEGGADEMRLGGSVLDQGGKQVAFGPLHVGDFDEGGMRVRRFGPQELCACALADSPGWPKTYVATLLLAEEDGGGFVDALRKLVDKLAAWAKKQLSELLVKAGKSLAGAVGAVVGAVLGEVVAYLIDHVAGWFSGLFDDVVMMPMVHRIKVKDVWQFEDSKDRTKQASGGGGRYEATIDFALR